MPIFTQDTTSRGWFEDLEATTGQVLGATAADAWRFSAGPSIAANERFRREQTGEGLPYGTELSPVLSPSEAQERVQAAGVELEIPEEGYRSTALDVLIEAKREEVKREAVLMRARGGFWEGAARLSVGLGVTLLDPLNVASAFVPVVGPARYSAMLARQSGRLGRAAVRARVGAVEGAAGAALIEPIVLGSAALYQSDYDMSDSLLNVAFGTVLGGGLHMGAGAAADALVRGRPFQAAQPVGSMAERLSNLPYETRKATLSTAVAQMAEGKKVSVEDLLDLETAWRRQDRAVYPGRAQRVDMEYFTGESFDPGQMAEVLQAIRTGNIEKPISLSEAIRRSGGVKDEGGDVAAMIGGARGRPGLISQTGENLDDLTGRLWEEGWFANTPFGRPGAGTRPEPSDLLVMLDDDVRSGGVFHPEDEAADMARQVDEVSEYLDRNNIDVRATTDEGVMAQVAMLRDREARQAEADMDVPGMADERVYDKRDLVDAAREQNTVDGSDFASMASSRWGDDLLESYSDDAAAEYDEAVEDALALADQLGEGDAARAEIAALDDLDALAVTYGRATEALALCQARRGA